ncbi:MAG TPA: cytochrome c [Candidatus Acidoferrales bacterium]|nr:cytochrome c [Candidatus Acidoferrales bacterium]
MRRLAFIAVGIALLSWLVACGKDKSQMTDAELGLNSQESRGRQIYNVRCAGCHTAYSSRGVKGPGLVNLYKKKYLPSGLPANDRFVTQAIVQGRGMMPPTGDTLTPDQLADLLAYLHTL